VENSNRFTRTGGFNLEIATCQRFFTEWWGWTGRVYFTTCLGSRWNLWYTSSLRNLCFHLYGSSVCPAGLQRNRGCANLFTYNYFGAPFFKPYRHDDFEPFCRNACLARSHSKCIWNLVASLPGSPACPRQAPATMPEDFRICGGAFGFPVSKSFSIRPAQFDFVLTRFQSNTS